jgi:single-strand DNA-binding protein
MYNKAILIGNLGRDPEIRRLEGGVVVGKFPIATNENYQDKSGEWQSKTEWHDIVVWRHLAEKAERDLKKGSLVFVEGKITHRKWQDNEGNNRYNTEIVASIMRTLDRSEKSGDSNYGNMPSVEDSPGASTSKESQAQDTPVDDLPF